MSAPLPTLPDWDSFPVYYLAKRYKTSAHHVADLVEEEVITGAIDLRGKGASRQLIRVSRAGVIEFEARRTISAQQNGNGRNGHSKNGHSRNGHQQKRKARR